MPEQEGPQHHAIDFGTTDVRQVDLEPGESLLVEVSENQFLVVRARKAGAEPSLAQPKVWRRTHPKGPNDPPGNDAGAVRFPWVPAPPVRMAPWVPDPPIQPARVPDKVLAALRIVPPKMAKGDTADLTGYVQLRDLGRPGA